MAFPLPLPPPPYVQCITEVLLHSLLYGRTGIGFKTNGQMEHEPS